MRIRLQQVGQFICVPLPGEVIRAPGFQPGEEVEVVFDAHARTVRIHPPVAQEAAVLDQDFPAIAEDVMQRHQAALRELAKL